MSKKNKNTEAAPQTGAKLPRKERKAQQKALYKQQLANEKQLIAEGKIPPRAKYRTGNFFWRVFALCIAFFFGLFAAVGGIVAFGVTAPVKDVLGVTGLDTSNILKEEYSAQSIVDLIKTISSDSFDSLASVSKYTPVLDDYLGTFETSLADLGIHLDIEQVKATKFEDLGTYFKDNVMETIVLGEVLGLNAFSDGLMLGICYGEEGTDYTVDENGKIVTVNPPLTIGDLTDNAQDIVKRITIEQALGVTANSNAAMRFLAYGTEGTDYKIEDGKIVMLPNELTGELFKKKTLADLTDTAATPIENARICDLITVESDTGILAAIRDWKISDLQDTYRIERLKISQLMDIDEHSSKITQAIADWRLGDFTDASKMDTLRLGDVIDVDESSPLILRSLQDTPIGEFGDAIDGLRLADILEEEDFEGNNFLKTLRMSSLTTLSQDLQALSAADVFGEEMYSYLDPAAQFEQKNFAELFDYYSKTGHADAEKSETAVPKAYELGANDAVHAYFVPKTGGSAKLTGGYYTGEAGSYAAISPSDVHSRKAAGDAVEYYVRREQPLTPAYTWQVVDYGNKGLAPLPAGDAVSTQTQGRTVVTAQGTPYTDAAGQPLYYLTTRAAFENGAPTGQTEEVAYPLLQNSYGVYYNYLKYTPGAEGPDKFSEERVDLEYALSSLSYEGEGGTVTLRKNADGAWVTSDESGETIVSVYEKPETHTGDVTTPGYFYIYTEEAAHYGYYAESGEIDRVYTESEVTEKFEIVTKGEGGAVTKTVAVDRYLSGVWFYLFGVDEGGHIVDRTDLPVLDLTDVMTGMTESLSNTELWQLYFNNLLTKDPFVDLSKVYAGGVSIGAKSVTNLNQCTVVECIELVEKLLHPLAAG